MRAERCLWLGVRLVSVSKIRPLSASPLMESINTNLFKLGRYLTYNVKTKQFIVTNLALSLANLTAENTEDRFDPKAPAVIE